MYCDHQSIAQTFKDQGPLKGKRSDRLNNWRLYLARFSGRMEIFYKPGKEHHNADALSRLTAAATTEAMAAITSDPKWRVDVVDIQPAFRQSIMKALPDDTRLRSIYKNILKRIESTVKQEEGLTTTRESFRVNPKIKLIY